MMYRAHYSLCVFRERIHTDSSLSDLKFHSASAFVTINWIFIKDHLNDNATANRQSGSNLINRMTMKNVFRNKLIIPLEILSSRY